MEISILRIPGITRKAMQLHIYMYFWGKSSFNTISDKHILYNNGLFLIQAIHLQILFLQIIY